MNDKTKRKAMVLLVPVLLTVIIFLFFRHNLPIIPPNTTTTELARIEKNIKVDTSELQTFILSTLNIPLPELTYRACLENRNKVMISLDGVSIDIEKLDLPSSDQSGAMDMKFSVDEDEYVHLYAQRKQYDCKSIRINQTTKVKVTGEYNLLFISEITKNSGRIDPSNATSTIDTSNSRLYVYLTPLSTLIIYILTLLAWCGLILLYTGIGSYIKKGVS